MSGKIVDPIKILVVVAVLGINISNCQGLGDNAPHWSTSPKFRVYAKQFMNAIQQLRDQIDRRRTLHPGADLKAVFGPVLAERKNVIRQGRDRLATFAEIMNHVLQEYENIETEINMPHDAGLKRTSRSLKRHANVVFHSWYPRDQGY